MSRYQMDKAMRQVILDPEALRRYQEDPALFLRDYDLSEEEREGLAKVDYRALYCLGAHPFILNGFATRAARSEGGPRAVPAQYKAAIADLDNMDYAT